MASVVASQVGLPATDSDRPLWWTEADQAELECLIRELVDGIDEHSPRCASCARGYPPCPHISQAIAIVLDWRMRRAQLSKARWLRMHFDAQEIRRERTLLRERA